MKLYMTGHILHYRITLFILYFSLCLFSTWPSSLHAETMHDYKVKAAFVYKFILFTNWPQSVLDKAEDTMVLGIVGPNPFGRVFEEVTKKKVKGRKFIIRYLSSNPSRSALCGCQVIFISRALGKHAPEILRRAAGCPVLTISDINGFIDMGGMIAFKTRHRRIRFMVNVGQARKAGITFSAQMLELAVEVVDREVISEASYPVYGRGRVLPEASHLTKMVMELHDE